MAGKADMTTAEFLQQQKRERNESPLEQDLRHQISVSGLPMPEREYRFYPKRRWRADFAWVAQRLLVEVEGATFVNGRHNRGSGFEKDAEKYNAAALMNWTVLRVTKTMIDNGTAIEMIRQALSPAHTALARGEE